jgi:phage N-6-adenine-methyltransferase
MTSVHFSSASSEWETPDDFYAVLNREFKFTRDVCATHANFKHPRFWSPEDDCLTKKWSGVCWMNPPYGREILKFIKKAAEEAVAGHATVVCLLPARTDTRWWHTYIWSDKAQKPLRGVEVRFIRGRLKFKGTAHCAPLPSCVVIFHRRKR